MILSPLRSKGTPVLVAISSLVVVLPLIIFAGCLSDPGPILEVRPSLIIAPLSPNFQATNYRMVGSVPTGDMVVRWHRSVSDTQLNFKGYYVSLWSSKVDTTNRGGVDTIGLRYIISVRVPSPPGHLDTTYTFPNMGLGRYTVFVRGVKSTDSLSIDSTGFSNDFDPRPLLNPTNLRATCGASGANGTGNNIIDLKWDNPPTDTNIGFMRYIIYYRDTTVTNTQWQASPLPTIVHGTAIPNEYQIPVAAPIAQQQAGFQPYYPYQFWIKSERNDSTFFYGGSDTSSIVWAGSAFVAPNGVADSLPADSSVRTLLNGGSGLGLCRHSLYFGPLGQNISVVDSTSDAQVILSVNGNTATLSVANTGVGFLNDGTGNARIDTAAALDSVYYAAPLADPSKFTIKSVTLPTVATSTGVIVYLMMTDDIVPLRGYQWARIFIHQVNGGFVTADKAILVRASFQPGVSKDGSKHLPFY